jgi:putative transferase (TIGR04331 family)
MFLITTADERTWKKDEKILLLGEWCKLYSRKHIWSDLKFDVLPYHWDDRDKMYRDYKCLGNVYERYLRNIAEKLNTIHGTNHTLRYWRIIIGPWLRYFSDSLYDRYCSLKMAADTNKVTSTYLMKSDHVAWAPNDFEQFHFDQTTDQWNHFIFSHIIKLLKEIPYSTINELNNPLQRNNQKNKQQMIKRFLKYAAKQYTKIISKKTGHITFVSSYFSTKDIIRLQLALREMPNPYWEKINIPNSVFNNCLRDKLRVSIAANEYEAILEALIPLQIPKAYVEAFPDLRDLALLNYPENIDVIWTANAYAGDEGFKVWCAEEVERGTKFVIGQHGGNMGTSLWQQSEDHQIAICDRFYSWGWTNREKNNINPLPAGKLINLRKRLSSDPKGSILWVMASLPRYSYCMYSVPVASQFLNYIDDQIIFAKSVLKPVFNLLQIRFEKVDFGWSFNSRLKDSGLGRIIESNEDDFIQSLKKSRLCISTHNATTFLQTFAGDYPTLIFWNPKYYELRCEAQSFFDELRRVGILHDTPESAAAILNEIYTDPISWWNQPELQTVKDVFCNQFAYTNKDWVQEMKTELLSLKKYQTNVCKSIE